MFLFRRDFIKNKRLTVIACKQVCVWVNTVPRYTTVLATRVKTMAAPFHGSISTFDATQEDWVEYAERLQHYFVANKIDDEDIQRAILLTNVGPSTYRLAKTLSLPRKPTDYTFDALVKMVTTHFHPKPSPIIKRFEFNTRSQEEGESVAVFVAALRSIAEHCQYPEDILPDMLRDRIVCGIRDKAVQRSLLKETRLTYQSALDTALGAEAAAHDAKQLQDRQKTLPVNRMGNGKAKKPAKTSAGGISDCYRCGGKHPATHCRYKEYDCHYCKKKGHLASVCRKKKAGLKSEESSEKGNTNIVEGDDDNPDYPLFNIPNCSISKPLLVKVAINGVSINMELDTGASVSVMGEDTYHLIRDTEKSLRHSPVKLHTYTGESIKVVGATDVTVEHNGQTITLPLIVMKGKGPPLLGRNWLTVLKLDWQHIFSVDSNHSLEEVLTRFDEVFDEGLGTVLGVKAKIHVNPQTTPLFHKARPVPHALKSKIEAELDRLLKEDIIEPVRFSNWATPIVPVPKGDSTIRICGDYKVTINRAAKLDKYPLPRIDDLFASLSGGKSFSKLDLSHAYQQVELEEESREFTTINTHRGLFSYNRLPFGISSAPSIFQRVMDTLLQGIPGVCVYLDDILITGGSDEEHLARLSEVLRRLVESGMRLKREKCSFLLHSVEYLGHVISSEGLKTSDTKVEAISNAPSPTNVSELRSFLGMVNYYGKFLPDLAATLSPLYSLLQKKKSWSWKKPQETAFRTVKESLKSSRVLVHFDPDLPLVLSCDASPYGVGAVLAHRMPGGDERPVGFASRSLSLSEKKYSHLDKEALAIIFGVRKFHHFIYGRSFELKTDHKPLVHIFSEKKATPVLSSGRIQRWALILGAYSYTIQYKEGRNNVCADAMSRLPLKSTFHRTPKPIELIHLMEYLDTSPTTSSQIRRWTDQDTELSKVRDWILSAWPEKALTDDCYLPYWRRRYELNVEEGCVLWGNRVVIPKRGRKVVMKMLHEGHTGIVRMKSFARSYVWWPGIDSELEQCVKVCTHCQLQRKVPPVMPLHPWAWPEKPWSRVHMDYAGPFEGKSFLVLVDAYSKWMEVHVTSSTTTSSTIELMRKSFATLGLPDVIVSDNAANFTSSEFSVFMRRNGIQHIRTPPYHPSSNGIAERAVQTLKDGLRKIKEGSLITRVSRFLFKYRITPHSITGISPGEMLFGRRLQSHLDHLRPNLRRKASLNQDRQKQWYNVHTKHRVFNIGDLVYARNYAQGDHWLPGKIIELHGNVMFTVLLEDGRKVKKHADQIIIRTEAYNQGAESADDDIIEDHTVITEDTSVPVDDHSPPAQGPSTQGSDQDGTQSPSLPLSPSHQSNLSHSTPNHSAESSEQENASPMDHPVRRSNRSRHPPKRFGSPLHY